MQNYMASTTPLHTPVGSPALTHHDPWAHAAICCDHDHGASSSVTHHHTYPSMQGGNPFTSGQRPHTASSQPHTACNGSTGENCMGDCPMEAYCCGGDYCCDEHQECQGADECCEDPSCEQTSDQCHDDHPCQEPCGPPHPPTGMEGLEQWADSKEGCNALQQLLECCNQPDCDIPVCTTDNAAVHPPQVDPLAAMFASMTAQPVAPTSTSAEPTPTPTSTIEAMSHTCHWGNCHLVFRSMPDLLAHVASDHLSAWGTAPKPIQASPNPTVPAPQPAPIHTGFIATPPSNSQGSFTTIDANLNVNTAFSTPQTSEADQLLSCLWDDCFPMTDLPSATSETFHPHNMSMGGQQAIQANLQAQNQAQAEAHAQAHAHAHSHVDHSHAHSHTAANGEPFSPGTMLRHVLEEHLGVPGEIIGWPNQPAMDSQQAGALLDKHHHHHHVDPHHLGYQHDHPHDHQHQHQHQHQQHQVPHQHHHHHQSQSQQFPTPPSTVNTLSSTSPTPMPTSTKPLICLWPGCPIGAAFPDSASLMDHLSEVHIPKGKDSYVCHWDGCGDGQGRVFKSRQKVLRHLQSHTGHKPFVCGVCDQAFSEAAPLSAHMRRHAQQKPFKCDYPGCGKTFAVSSSLTIHTRTHNGEKPYICPHCGRGFVEASNLTKHIRTHTGERPFACAHPNCGKRFSRPDQLKRHMSVHDKPAAGAGAGGGHARHRSNASASVAVASG